MIKINGKPVEIGKFPDGTALLKCDPYKFTSTSYAKFSWYYENDAEFLTLTYLVKHFRSLGIKDLYLFMPYIPNARMDRVKSREDVFTLKYFAELLNDLEFTQIDVLDPHSSVSEALINNIYVYNPKSYITRVMDQIKQTRSENGLLVFYPDEGSMKRYSGIVSEPYAFGIKKRDWMTGKIEGLDVVDNGYSIHLHDILIVDDICSRGGTFYHSAKKLKELGAKDIYLYVSHCENTILEGELLEGDLIKKVYTTDSIFTKSHEKIEVLK